MAWELEKAAVRGQMQYRTNFFSMIAVGLVWQGTGFAFLAVVMASVPSIEGWRLEEMALLYGLRLLAHSLWVLPLSHLWTIDRAVREAEFDRYLLRPLSPFVQFLTSRFQMTALGDLLAAALVLGYAISAVDVSLDPVSLLYLVTAVVGGALIEGSIQMMLATTAFRALSTSALRGLTDTVFSLVGSYPLVIFSKAVQGLFVIVPISFVAYFPAAIVLGKQESLVVPPWVAHLSLPVGICFVFLSALFWRKEIRNYQSSGN
ncbi:ABC transporter permease [Streptomyces mutabilis]|uniref:ABC transporter permease n=1 Tax=Streptomyces TaxID=1883 RepID=UPI00211BFDC1|nr:MULTISPECIES: ABC-2 family transporter protein [unclassified Streptomyces]MDG9694222.1 ABC-2 family transporter protein [Streptomyces sp. DH17]MDN3245196.1 ABC-2 family transporter protein [Streptomyces sp. ZSW22]MDQ0384742.1 ABC-2 type transport system permease protein [Streptomyces sp. DSM 42143]